MRCATAALRSAQVGPCAGTIRGYQVRTQPRPPTETMITMTDRDLHPTPGASAAPGADAPPPEAAPPQAGPTQPGGPQPGATPPVTPPQAAPQAGPRHIPRSRLGGVWIALIAGALVLLLLLIFI